MEFNVSTVAAIIALLVSLSATYNAYILRGGKLAWSQVLTAFGTVSLMFSIVISNSAFFKTYSVDNSSFVSRSPELLYIAGFIFLFLGTWKLRTSLK